MLYDWATINVFPGARGEGRHPWRHLGSGGEQNEGGEFLQSISEPRGRLHHEVCGRVGHGPQRIRRRCLRQIPFAVRSDIKWRLIPEPLCFHQIADWLSSGSEPATFLSMDESHRPVKLRKVVLGFPCSATQTEFKFDLSLNYKMANIIQTYSDQKPSLVVSRPVKRIK